MVEDRVINGGQEMPEQQFLFLGSMVRNDKKFEEDVTHKIRMGWMKQRRPYIPDCCELYNVLIPSCMYILIGQAW